MGVYRAGSRAVQDQAGVRDRADHVGRSLGRTIKPVAAAFLEQQPLLIVGAADPRTGRVWVEALTGDPGFVRATGPHRITVDTAHRSGSRLRDHTGGTRGPADGAGARGGITHPAGGPTAVGTIALDPRTRRRMRLNGHLRPTATGFTVDAEQVFANCPKYIQRRESYETVDRTPGTPRHLTRLGTGEADFIGAADTFFLGTVHRTGADASHRGGSPGFVRVASPHELTWPDYSGNAMFLSLGNLHADPRAGLLFLDWETGSTLQLTGEARTESGRDGTRTVRFTLAEAWWTPAALPLRWSAPEYSPANPEPGR